MPGGLILVSFRLDVEPEAPFSAFYHHRYLPNLMREMPEIRAAWRYQEHQVTGSLRYYRKQFLTLLACESADAAQRALQAIEARAGDHVDEREWREWCARAMHDLEPPRLYRERWAHPRTPLDGSFASRPIFMVSVELAGGEEQRFHDWYETAYLPRNVADVPSWVACRRYSSVGRRPARHLAIYEAADLPGLDASLEAMRAPFRMAENMSWKRWDTGTPPTITWEDAAMFKPIFRAP
jgi:hypothetical protein